MLISMRQVELHRYWIILPGRKFACLTDFVMDAETAQRQYPDAVADASSRVVCEEPETEEERTEWMSPHFVAGDRFLNGIPAKPGAYEFLDDMFGAPQVLEVVQRDGGLFARFPAVDGEDGADLPVEDLAGQFRLLHRPP
jgi:hypothetical protein